MTTHTLLGPWVELQSEPRRGGRSSTLAVNRRDGAAMLLDAHELATLFESAGTGSLDPHLLGELERSGFLAAAPPPAPPPRRGRALRILRTFDVHWTGAHRHVCELHRRLLHRAWAPAWIVAQAGLAVAGLLALLAILRSGRPLELRPEPWEVPVYVALSLIAIVVHELAHALVIARNGRRVASVGFRLHLGSPAFYVESVEALLLPRRQRIVQAAAGPWAEWLFTSAVALGLWLAPTGDLVTILHRFVVLTAFTIATNLLPFAGLDGALIFADLIREPNLAADSKDAVARLGADRRAGDGALLAYAAANTVVSTGLFLTAVWFWHALFGGVLGTLAGRGPLGWLVATALVGVSFGPSVLATVPHLRRWSPIDQLAFRLERRARIRLAEQFATVAPFDELDDVALGVLAGRLRIRRVQRWSPLHEEGFSGFVASDGPVELGRDGRIDDVGVAVAGGPGVAATTWRLRPVRVGLLPSASLPLLGLSASHPSCGATDDRRRVKRAGEHTARVVGHNVGRAVFRQRGDSGTNTARRHRRNPCSHPFAVRF